MSDCGDVHDQRFEIELNEMQAFHARLLHCFLAVLVVPALLKYMGAEVGSVCRVCVA